VRKGSWIPTVVHVSVNGGLVETGGGLGRSYIIQRISQKPIYCHFYRHPPRTFGSKQMGQSNAGLPFPSPQNECWTAGVAKGQWGPNSLEKWGSGQGPPFVQLAM